MIITKMGFTVSVSSPFMLVPAPKTKKMPLNRQAKQSRLKNIKKAQLQKTKNTEKSRGGAEIVCDHMTH